MKTNWPALRHGYLILASVALATSPTLAQTPAGATAGGAVISSVAITQAPERSAVRVEGEGVSASVFPMMQTCSPGCSSKRAADLGAWAKTGRRARPATPAMRVMTNDE